MKNVLIALIFGATLAEVSLAQSSKPRTAEVEINDYRNGSG